MSASKHLSDPQPPVCLDELGQRLVNQLHAEGRDVISQRDDLLAACKAVRSALLRDDAPQLIDLCLAALDKGIAKAEGAQS